MGLTEVLSAWLHFLKLESFPKNFGTRQLSLPNVFRSDSWSHANKPEQMVYKRPHLQVTADLFATFVWCLSSWFYYFLFFTSLQLHPTDLGCNIIHTLCAYFYAAWSCCYGIARLLIAICLCHFTTWICRLFCCPEGANFNWISFKRIFKSIPQTQLLLPLHFALPSGARGVCVMLNWNMQKRQSVELSDFCITNTARNSQRQQVNKRCCNLSTKSSKPDLHFKCGVASK